MKTLINTIRTKAIDVAQDLKEAVTETAKQNLFTHQVATVQEPHSLSTKQWYVHLLLEQSQLVPTQTVSVEALYNHSPSNQVITTESRVRAADLSYPLLVDASSGMILDGRHRLVKAKRLGIAHIEIKYINLPPHPHIVALGRTVLTVDKAAVAQINKACTKTLLANMKAVVRKHVTI